MDQRSRRDKAGGLGDRALITVFIVGTQVHGYRRGHQLLSSSVALSKGDQSVIDRLSDVAGPLRPNERFKPYLSGYPLPGGSHYVLARTWQDLTVTRAGCVRTLSLIISASDWASAKSLVPFLDLLDPAVLPDVATAVVHKVAPEPFVRSLPPVQDFRAGEFLEALFLEESKPVAVFGALAPELITTRLLTAVWSALRRRLAFSTFARSPRRIEGRPFDLVFAPKDARQKFADWPGRRVDGTADLGVRHRWTSLIAQRVFEDPMPRLLSERDIALAGPNDAETAALLRISLLWDELVAKIDTTPTAALGLLDIANSRGVWNPDTLNALDPAIETAARAALANMSPENAWDFVGALVRKMQGHFLQRGRHALKDVTGQLSTLSPKGAIAFLSQPVSEDIMLDLIPVIADGIAADKTDEAPRAIVSAASDVVGRMVAASDAVAHRLADEPLLIGRMRAALGELDPQLLVAVRGRVLPLLVHDWQLPLAAPLIETLDLEGLMDEVLHLERIVDLAIPAFVDPIISRAHALDGIWALRERLLGLPRGVGRDEFLLATLKPSPADISWLLDEHRIPGDLIPQWLVVVFRMANPLEIVAILADVGIRDRVLSALPADAVDVRRRVLAEGALPLDVHVCVLLDVLSRVDACEARCLANSVLARCLRVHFGRNEAQTIMQLLEAVGQEVDGGWLARQGLERGVPATVASRNLLAFHTSPAPVRARLLAAVDEIASAIDGRHMIDIDASAIEAFAALLADANHVAWSAALTASGRILPLLMRSWREPVSPLVAVAFPAVYRELAKVDDVPDILGFIPFLDWDRCKSARRELVSAFLKSSWAPGDLALTAYRCGDVEKILRQTAKTYGGDEYINRVAADLGRLSIPCRQAIEDAIANMRADWSAKYDWRD